jgi:hypothetical protein
MKICVMWATPFPVFLIFVCFLATNTVVLSQGTFQDLDFENAVIERLGTAYSAAAAFPGWQVLIGTTPTSTVFYDDVSIGAPNVSIIDDKTGYVPIDGNNFTAYLQGATLGNQSTSVSLTQTGMVPTGTESIQLDANQSPGSSFVVFLNGGAVNMVPLESYPTYTLYGGNVSAWSGQSAALEITELAPSNPQFSPSLLQLDDIVFSPTTVVPEPSPVALAGIGSVLFAGYRSWREKRR